MDGTTLNKEWNGLLFDVRRSMRYHSARVRHFERLNSWITFFSLVAGSATFAVLLTKLNKAFSLATSAAIAIFTAFNLVFRTAHQARVHSDLYRRFANLELELTVANPTPELLQKFRGERIRIETDEPPILSVLDVICHNELCQAMGKKERYSLSRMQLICANWIDIDADKFRKEQAGV